MSLSWYRSASPATLHPLAGMLGMSFAFWFHAIAVVLARVRAIMLERERGAAWVAALPEVNNGGRP